MPNKIQQFYIFKFTTTRLKKYDYNIKLSVNQAKKNNELVSIGDSQMLRSLRRLKFQPVDQAYIDDLFIEKRKIKNKKSSVENIGQIREIESKINDILFVPEIISIIVDNGRHYKAIVEEGLFINDYKYVRLMCGAGHLRRNNVLFVREDFEKPLKNVLNNGRRDENIVPAKYNAYFALSSSSSYPVTMPNFTVIPDCEISRKEIVDDIEEIGGQETDDLVVEKEKELKFNLFDGQGIVSPKLAKIWANDLGLQYVPSSFIIRSCFIKGMVCVIDFQDFANKYNKHTTMDAWGKEVNVDGIDLILTTSQFKLWDNYVSQKEYQSNCEINNITWNVSRYAPEHDNKFVFSNYQFLQALNLSKYEIEKLCTPTINYFKDVVLNNIDKTLLYLMGKHTNQLDQDVLSKIHDNITKALVYNNDLIQDPYIQNHLIHSLNKKIKESYIGNLLLGGNYQILIGDPYAFLEYMFGMEVKGLLNRDEHYSNYWAEKGVDKVAAMRAPLTWRSEVNILNIKNSDEIKYWYKYLHSGIILNVHGVDHMLFGGSDSDGDLIMTTDNPIILQGYTGGNPISYDAKKATKERIVENNLYKNDLSGFNTRIGFITNVSTTMYAMLPHYEKNGKEYNEIIKRLKICRRAQGNEIDKAKGLIVKDFPKSWTNWGKVIEGMTDEQKQTIDFNNSILVEKRPYFMRYLYSNYNKKYMKHNYNYDIYAISHFGKNRIDILSSNNSALSADELKFKEFYYKFSPLVDSDCLMNNVCHYMEQNIKEIKENGRRAISDENILLLKDNDIEIDKIKLKRLYDLFKKYKSEKRNFANIMDGDIERFKTIEQYNKFIKTEAFNISSDGQELANLAISICYEIHPNDNKTFAWGVFGEEIINNVYKNRQTIVKIPFVDDFGNIEWLGNKYSSKEINI